MRLHCRIIVPRAGKCASTTSRAEATLAVMSYSPIRMKNSLQRLVEMYSIVLRLAVLNLSIRTDMELNKMYNVERHCFCMLSTTTHHCCLSAFSCFLLSWTTVRPQLQSGKDRFFFSPHSHSVVISGISLPSAGHLAPCYLGHNSWINHQTLFHWILSWSHERSSKKVKDFFAFRYELNVIISKSTEIHYRSVAVIYCRV